MKSVYFFDTYEFTRWFDDRLLWDYVPGDNTTVPDRPCIGKSRPIAGDNANLVLLNLDKVRHFVFLKDDIPFRAKRDKAIFQLDINYKPHRRRFMERYFGSTTSKSRRITPTSKSGCITISPIPNGPRRSSQTPTGMSGSSATASAKS